LIFVFRRDKPPNPQDEEESDDSTGSSEWDVREEDLKDCPDGMSFSDYITLRMDVGIPEGTTLEEYKAYEKDRKEIEYYKNDP
jgi:hypothetical protein